MAEHPTTEEPSVVCHRCGALHKPRQPLFYVVRIEAFCAPELPPLTAEDLRADFEAELARILEEVKGLSEQEMMDQVYRKLTLYLCPTCYHRWIENPTG